MNKITFLGDGTKRTAFCADCGTDAILPGKDFAPQTIDAMKRIYFET